MISLRQARDAIKNECDNRESCTGCKFDRLGLGVCTIKNITDKKIEQLGEILKDDSKSLILEQMEIELGRLRRAVEDLKCLK